eukprot:735655-Pyramimonas_sp.AAC.1
MCIRDSLSGGRTAGRGAPFENYGSPYYWTASRHSDATHRAEGTEADNSWECSQAIALASGVPADSWHAVHPTAADVRSLGADSVDV